MAAKILLMHLTVAYRDYYRTVSIVPQIHWMDSVWHATKTAKTMPKFRKACCCTTRKPGFPFHSIRTSAKQGNNNNNSTRQHHLQLRRQSLRLFMSQPHVASSTTTENDNEAAVDTCCHLLPTLVSLCCASVICIKCQQQLVGAPHWECHAHFFYSSSTACETMHINHDNDDDGNSSSSTRLLYTRIKL